MRVIPVLLGMLALSLGAGEHAWAQGGLGSGAGTRVDRGLFGRGLGGRGGSESLDFEASVSGAFNTDVPHELQPRLNPGGFQIQGVSSILTGLGRYSRPFGRVNFGASGFAAFSYARDLEAFRSIRHSGTLRASSDLTRLDTVSLNQTIIYRPPQLYGIVPVDFEDDDPSDVGVIEPEHAIRVQSSYAFITSARWSHELTRRSGVSVRGNLRFVDQVEESNRVRDLNTRELRAMYRHSLGRRSYVTAGYRMRNGTVRYTEGATTTERGALFGFGQTKMLSATRSLRYDVTGGLDTIDVPMFVEAESLPGRRYRFTVNAGISTQLFRSWTARGFYRRRLEYVNELPDPVFADSLGVAVNGLLSRRLTLSLNAAYSNGASLTTLRTSQFVTRIGSARLRYALTERIASYGDYIYYNYEFGGSSVPTGAYADGLTRHGIRGGIAVWVSAIN